METNVCCKDGVNITINVNCGCKCGGGNIPEPPTPETPKIYGIRIDKNNPDPAGRITYTNDAVGMRPAFMNFETGVFDYGDWEDVWFVKENKPVMLNYDGTEAYDLNPNNYSKKLDGTPSDVANPDFLGNAMAKMPLVWMKNWEDEQYEYYNVCQTRPDETYHANAFTRADGSVADCKYLRMFYSSLINGKLRSLSGQRPSTNQLPNQEVSGAQNNGSQWYITSFSEWDLIGSLIRLLSKTEDSQRAFGCGHTGAATTAASLITTGTLGNQGQFMGYSDNMRQVKIFHMEKPWADAYERLAGCVSMGGKVKVKPYPPYNIAGTGYIETGIIAKTTTCGYVNRAKVTPLGRLPLELNGAEHTYLCDISCLDTSLDCMLLFGGRCGGTQYQCGISAFHLGATLRNEWHIGVGLSCEQPKTK